MVTATGFEKDIDLPGPVRRDRGLLQQVTRSIPAAELTRSGVNRFPAGVTWLPWGAGGLNIDEVGCNANYDKQPGDFPDVALQEAFLVWDSVQCSTLSANMDQLRGRLDTYFDVYLSAAFARALEHGGTNRMTLTNTATVVQASAES